MEDDEETKSNDVVREMNSKGTKTSKVSKEKPSGEVKARKKIKLDADKPSMSIHDVEEAITMQGNLKPFSKFYDKLDDAGKRNLEEAIVKYLNIFNRDFVEIMFEIPKSLYDILEMRRGSAKVEDERLKEYVLANLCPMIAVEEVNRILKEAKW